MPIAKITGQGLSAIALSVALLWGCWMEERAVLRRADRERVEVLRDLQRLRTIPSHIAVPPGRIHPRPARLG